MKINKKQLQNIFMIVMVIIAMVGFSFWVKQKIKLLRQGIDNMEPRPFSELLAADFSDVTDEPADPSKCDGNKVLDQIQKSSTSPNLASKWRDYDPNIHKLTILDNCWRQYENEYVKFKFRDLNGSLNMEGVNVFSIKDTYGNDTRNIYFGAYKNEKSGEGYYEAVSSNIRVIDVSRESRLKNPLSVRLYKNQQGLVILRTEVMSYAAILIKKIYYTIDATSTDRYISVSADSNHVPYAESARIIKDILSTIEIKK